MWGSTRRRLPACRRRARWCRSPSSATSARAGSTRTRAAGSPRRWPRGSTRSAGRSPSSITAGSTCASSSPAALAAGEGFTIIEINGVGGEAIDAWDPDLSVGEVYRRLYRQQVLLFAIGDRNRRRGFAPPGLVASLRPAFRQSQLIGRYPASS